MWLSRRSAGGGARNRDNRVPDTTGDQKRERLDVLWSSHVRALWEFIPKSDTTPLLFRGLPVVSGFNKTQAPHLATNLCSIMSVFGEAGKRESRADCITGRRRRSSALLTEENRSSNMKNILKANKLSVRAPLSPHWPEALCHSLRKKRHGIEDERASAADRAEVRLWSFPMRVGVADAARGAAPFMKGSDKDGHGGKTLNVQSRGENQKFFPYISARWSPIFKFIGNGSSIFKETVQHCGVKRTRFRKWKSCWGTPRQDALSGSKPLWPPTCKCPGKYALPRVLSVKT